MTDNNFLTEQQARDKVAQYMATEQPARSTQALLRESRIAPRLGNFVIKPGKVSDSIHGGNGSFIVDEGTWLKEFQPYMSGLPYAVSAPFTVMEKGKPVQKVRVGYENPELTTREGTPLRLMIRTDRISTHDVNRGTIPFKDQILAVNHHMMRNITREVLGTSQFDAPGLFDTSVVIAAENLRTIPIEFVVRAYMAKTDTSTSLYQAWVAQKDQLTSFCGHPVDGKTLFANCKLPYAMDTPSTKSDVDESMSSQELIRRGLCTSAEYQQMRNAALVGFGVVTQFLAERGLILADTKTEHGVNQKGQIVAQDELYTMDSSRFWLTRDYHEQLAKLKRGEITVLEPASFSKQFAREFSKGKEPYTGDQRREIAVRYILGIQHLVEKNFEPDMRSREERVVSGLQTIVEQLL